MNGMTTNKSLLAGALLLAGSSAFALTGSADSASVFLDTVAPTPGTATPPPTGLLTGFSVPYSSATDGTGTGLARVELWAREDAASWAFSSLFQATAGGSFSYTPAGAGTFHFDLVAEDAVGNRSAAPSGSTGTGDGTTLVSGDTTNPVARCQSIAVTLDGGTGTATITAAQIDNGSTDDIAIQSIVVTPDTFNCDDIGANTVTLTVTDTSNNQDSCQATVTVNRGTACDDGDGISIATEDAGPNGGDGNNDGTLDSFQANVATFLNGADAGANVGQYLTLVSPADTQLSDVGVFPAIPPLPGGVTSFPLGMVSFQVSGPGVQPFPAATVVTLIAEQTPSPITGSYYKVDGPVYTPFDFPVFPLGVTSTGTVFDGTRTWTITLSDDDGTFGHALTGDLDASFGLIVDPGGPAVNAPLAVSLASFTATSTVDGVRLDWATVAELNNAGFNVYRAEGAGLVQLNGAIIPAEGLDGAGALYSYLDGSTTAGSYFLEDVDLNGTKTLHGPVTAASTTAVKEWMMY